jgi:hypothetical protein
MFRFPRAADQLEHGAFPVDATYTFEIPQAFVVGEDELKKLLGLLTNRIGVPEIAGAGAGGIGVAAGLVGEAPGAGDGVAPDVCKSLIQRLFRNGGPAVGGAAERLCAFSSQCSVKVWVPMGVVPDHLIQRDQQLAHARGQFPGRAVSHLLTSF